jgi:hypothetical protein
MPDDSERLDALIAALAPYKVEHQPETIPSLFLGGTERDGLRAFLRRCPHVGTPVGGVIVTVRGPHYRWNNGAAHSAEDPDGAAKRIHRTITDQP